MTSYPTAEVERRLQDEANVWMATVRPDGRAHLVPIWFVWVLGKFWICTGTDTVKMRNLRANPSIAISLENGNAPVIAEGRIESVDAPYPAEVLSEFSRKYQWDLNGDNAATHSMFSSTPTKWIHWNA